MCCCFRMQCVKASVQCVFCFCMPCVKAAVQCVVVFVYSVLMLQCSVLLLCLFLSLSLVRY